MSVFSIIQNAFTGGEWAPSLYARTDLAKYYTAVRKMRNCVVHPHGGASNRGGTRFIAEVKYSDRYTRLIPFQFSVIQSYILEFGHKYIRVFKDDGYVIYPPGYPYPGNVVEINTDYEEADLQLLKFTQSADVLYLTHPSYPPKKLSRTSHYDWTIANINFTAAILPPTLATTGSGSIRYVVTSVNEGGNESLPSNSVVAGTGIQITWSPVADAVYFNVYHDKANSGQYYYIGKATNEYFTEPTGGIDADKDRSPPVANSPFTGLDNYPGVCSFFEQRLMFARTNNNPQTVWGSVIGDFENMNIAYPIKDSDSYEFTLNAKQVNEIRWIAPLNEVLLGTSGGEWRMASGSASDAISPTNVNLKQQSQWGVSHVQPIIVGNTLLFITGAGDKIRDLLYSFEVDGYAGNDLTILANHLFRNYTLTDWSFQQYPDSIIWCVRDDGKLLGLTYLKEHEVMAWHVHETDGLFESVATIQTSEGQTDLYCIVKRFIDGAWIRYIERFKDRLPSNSDFNMDIRNSYFVDCGLSLDNPITITNITKAPLTVTAPGHGLSTGDEVDLAEVVGMTDVNNLRFKITVSGDDLALTWPDDSAVDDTEFGDYSSGGVLRKAVSSLSGLDHLEGKEVVVLADGSVIKGMTVTGGALTLAHKASRIHVGLSYTSDIETMDYDAQSANASTLQDRIRNINSAFLRLENTASLLVGPRFDDTLVEIPFRTNEGLGQPINLFTGDKEALLEASTFQEGRVCLRNTDPLPFTVLAIIPRMDAGEN